MKIIDITYPIEDGMTVYPNNAPVSIKPYATIKDGSSSNLSEVSLGTHTGTHVDAPLHVFDGDAKLEDLPLEKFIGKCRVIDASYKGFGELVDTEDIGEVQPGERILVKTSNSFKGIEDFYPDFVALSGNAAEYLADKEIALFGIDYLSIKQKGSKDNRAHTALLSKRIPIVEGLNLSEVSVGEYDLYCLPMKLSNVEGGPVRAILIDNNQ